MSGDNIPAEPVARRRGGLRFSLLTLLFAVLLSGSAAALWHNWEPWALRWTRAYYERTVHAATISPDSQHVAISLIDLVIVCNAQTGAERTRLKGHDNSIRDAQFSADSTRMVTAGFDGKAIVWNVAAGKQLFELRPNKAVLAAAFSPDGRHVVTSDLDGHLITWNAQSGAREQTQEKIGYASQIAFAADNRTVLAMCYNSIWIWDTKHEANAIQHKLGDDVSVLTLSVVGNEPRVLLNGPAQQLRIWRGSRAQNIEFTGNDETVNCSAISADDVRVAACAASRTKIWDAGKGLPVYDLPNTAPRAISQLAISADGKLIAQCVDYSEVFLHERRRPEQLWGIAWLPETWLTLMLAGAFVWSLLRDLRGRR